MMNAHFEIVQWESGEQEFKATDESVRTPHLASALVDGAFFNNWAQYQSAMRQCYEVFFLLQLSIKEHFRHLRTPDGKGGVLEDWALSDLALFLLLLDAGMEKSAATRVKLFAVRHLFRL